MKYLIKAFLIGENNSLDCRFEALLPDINDAIEFLSRIDLFESYDYVKVFPYEKEM